LVPAVMTIVTLFVIRRNIIPHESVFNGGGLRSKAPQTVDHNLTPMQLNSLDSVEIFEANGNRVPESLIRALEAHDVNRNNDQNDRLKDREVELVSEKLEVVAAERDSLVVENERLQTKLEHTQDELMATESENNNLKNNNDAATHTSNNIVTDTASSSSWDPYDVTPLEEYTDAQLLRPKPQIVDPKYVAAIKWLTARQKRTKEECESYGVVGVHLSDHIPGFPGVGALLQAFIMKIVAVVTQTKKGFEPLGHLRWYTNNSMCNQLASANAKTGLNCFYEPLGSCAGASNVTAFYDEFNFTKRGTGVPALALVNKAMLRKPSDEPFFFPPKLLNETGTVTDPHNIYSLSDPDSPQRFAQQLWWGAIHGYILRLNKREAARVARIRVRGGLASIDIALHIRVGDKLTDPMSLQLVTKPKGPEYYLEQAASLVRHIRSECAPLGPCAPVVVYVASDNRPAVQLAYSWEKRQNEIMGTNAVRVVGLCSQTQIVSSAAGTRGIDEDIRDGTGKADKSSVAEEVIIDLAVLQQARYFVGLCMSQMARAAVAVGLAQGTMEHAIAIDEENLVMWTPTKPAIKNWRNPGYRGWRGLYEVDKADRIENPADLVLPELVTQRSTLPSSTELTEPALCAPVYSQFGSSPPAITATSMYHNWVTLVTVSGSFLRAFQNWLLFYNRLALPVPVIVMTLDEKAYEWCTQNMGGAVYQVKKAEEMVKITVNEAFNSPAYNKIVTQRPTQILALLRQGTNVLYVDIDSVLLRDPFPWFIGNQASIWAANDAADKVKAGPFHACTGFLAIKSTKDSLRLMTLWEEKMAEKLQRNQMVFNKVIKDEGAIGKEVRFLPEPVFRRGKELNAVASDLFINNTIASDVAWIHANYLIGLVPKVMHLRQWGAWPLTV